MLPKVMRKYIKATLMEKLWVWLDDDYVNRPMNKDRYDLHIDSAQLAIDMIKDGKIGFISLDNDLGTGCYEGRTVAEFIEKEYLQGNIPFVGFHPHTANSAAFDAIMACKRAVYRHAMSINDPDFDKYRH